MFAPELDYQSYGLRGVGSQAGLPVVWAAWGLLLGWITSRVGCLGMAPGLDCQSCGLSGDGSRAGLITSLVGCLLMCFAFGAGRVGSAKT